MSKIKIVETEYVCLLNALLFVQHNEVVPDIILENVEILNNGIFINKDKVYKRDVFGSDS